MYQVFVGDNLLYAQSLIGYGYDLLTGKITEELNTVPHFDFSVPPSNPSAQYVTTGAEIVVVEDGEERFRGRVLSVSSNFRSALTVKAEGVLAYLNDAVVRPYTYTGSVAGLFSQLISGYNARVNTGKKFTVGTCDITGTVEVEETALGVYYAAIMRLVTERGGYVWTRRVEGDSDYNEINYTAAIGQQGAQRVQFGVNLLDLTRARDIADVYTVIIPRGGTPEGATDPVGIEHVVGHRTDPSEEWGQDWIANEAAVSSYGVIERVVEFPDITDADALWTAANTAVHSVTLEANGITVSALDLSRMGQPVDEMQVGNRYKLISAPHGLNNVEIMLTRAETDILQVSRSSFTFGAVPKTISRKVAQGGTT